LNGRRFIPATTPLSFALDSGRFKKEMIMCPQVLNAFGLVLNLIGVIILFYYGFPQPTHEEGAGIGLESGTRLSDGRTVAERDEDVRKTKAEYVAKSRLALGFIVAGFVFQFCSIFISN
jgi:hypothetical protein